MKYLKFLQITISILILALFVIPIYVDYDFNLDGETIYIFENFKFVLLHSFFLIFWIINYFTNNKNIKSISLILFSIISLFYFFLAINFVFLEAKHIYPKYGSYFLFLYLPLILTLSSKINKLN